MTGPADGSTYAAPASVSLTADAADSHGSIVVVEFYNGATLIGSADWKSCRRLARCRYKRLKTAAETTTYVYNALGERMKKSNQNGLATVFHYGPNGELLWEKDQAGNTRAYVWLNGRPLARIDNDAQIYFYHVDHLGTPQAMSDSAGSLVWKASYEPFGKATVNPASTIEKT